MNRKFDFSEIDGALPDAEKMQERERMTEALEENCKAVRVLCDRMESECSKLIGRLSAGNRVIISSTAFWCMIEDSSSLRQPSSASVPQTCISCTAYGC